MLNKCTLLILAITFFSLPPYPLEAMEGDPYSQPAHMGGVAGFPERQPTPQYDPFANTDDDKLKGEKPEEIDPDPYMPRKQQRYSNPQLFMEQSMMGETPPAGMNPAMKNYGIEQSLLTPQADVMDPPTAPSAGNTNQSFKNDGTGQSVLAPKTDIMGPPAIPTAGMMIDESPPQPKDELTRRLHRLEDEYLQALRDSSTPQSRIKELELEMDAVLKKTYLPRAEDSILKKK